MDSYAKLLLSNEAWVKEKLDLREDFFQRAVSGQKPEFLWIGCSGCSDSRVPAEDVTGSEPGELFVHRNIANQVSENDLSVLSVLQYAVEALQVQHIIVCGHYHCGGVLHAMQHEDRGVLGQWLAQLKAIYRSHADELERLADSALRFDRMVELNVAAQLRNIAQTNVVRKAWAERQGPHLHGWVYDLRSGRLKELETLQAGKHLSTAR
jgi:carbonic anhydrase